MIKTSYIFLTYACYADHVDETMNQINKSKLVTAFTPTDIIIQKSVSGRPSYALTLERHGRPQQTIRIGDVRKLSWSEACTKAQKIVERLSEKAAPQISASVNQTFAEFLDKHYVPYVRARQRSGAAVESYVRNWIVPLLGTKSLGEIDRADVEFLTRSMELAGLRPGSVNRALNILKSAFSKAIEWQLGGITQSPASGVSELRDPPTKNRFLSPDEAAMLIQCVRASRNPMLFPIVGFLLMTGARRSEVLRAQWAHVNVNQRIWTIPISKSGKPRYIPLSEAALSYLQEAKRIAGSDSNSPFVFPNPATAKPFVNIFHAWDHARHAAGLTDVRLHDLRHSFASALVNTGMSIYDVKELLGHSSITTTQRYAHLSPDRLLRATEAVAGHFQVLSADDTE